MTERSIGWELWSQPESFLRHFSDQAVLLENLYRVLYDCSKVQEECGKKIRKIVASYSKGQIQDVSHIQKSFSSLLQLLQLFGTELESDAQTTTSNVLTPLKTLIGSHKKAIDLQNSSIEKVRVGMNSNRKMVEASWRQYYHSFKDYQTAMGRSRNIDIDKSLTLLDNEKGREIADQKKMDYESFMARYALDVETYNTNKKNNYQKMFDSLEYVDLSVRSMEDNVQELLLNMVISKDKLAAEMQMACGSANTVFSEISAAEDLQQQLIRLADFKIPPVDLRLVMLAKTPCEPTLVAAEMFEIDDLSVCPQLTPAAKVAGGKRVDHLRSPFIFGLGLNPISEKEMSIIQVDNRLKVVQRQLLDTTHRIEALDKMLKTYEDNPKLGDSRKVQPQRDSYSRRANSIQLCLNRLQTRFNELGGEEQLYEARASMHRRREEWENGSQEVFSMTTASGTSMDSFNSFDSEPEEPVAPSNFQPPSQEPEYYAMTKYKYGGNGEKYPAFDVGQRFRIIEPDTSETGWTGVASGDGSTQCYVPTAYIDITLTVRESP